jgi:hypothetical protein
MAFVYDVPAGAQLSTNSTPSTALVNMAIRQNTRGVDIQAFSVIGKGAALTAITGLAFRALRWTTAGSGGTAITPNPRRIGTVASTTAADSQTTITAGTVSGVVQLVFGCGAAGPGGWAAMNPDSMIHIEGSSSDEIDLNSFSGVASMGFELGAEIAE